MTERSDQPDSPLTSITRGASFFAVGRVVSKVLGFFTNLLLTRTLGSGLYGIYAYGTTVLSFAAVFTDLGTDQALMKFIPEYREEPRKRDQIVGLVTLTLLTASILASVLLYTLAPLINSFTLQQPLFVDALRIFAVALPFKALVTGIVSSLKGLELAKYQTFVSSIMMAIARLVLVAFAVVLGYALQGIVTAVVLSWVVTFLVGFGLFLFRTPLRPALTRSKSRIFRLYSFSIPMTIGRLGNILQSRTDVLMVGFFLSSDAVGIYNIAVVLAGFLQLPLQGFNQLFPSVASRLYAEGNITELESVYGQVTRWTLTAILLPTLVLVIYPSEVLAVFGQDFTAGSGVLQLFAFGQLVYAAVGSSGYLLVMTEHQYLAMANQWGLGVLNVTLNYYFIQMFGVIGAALASAGLIAVVNLLTLFEIWYTEGLHPYSRSYLKPLLAGGVAGAAMYLLTTIFSNYVLLVIGSSCGVVVYTLIIASLGIEEDDKEFFEEYLSTVGLW